MPTNTSNNQPFYQLFHKFFTLSAVFTNVTEYGDFNPKLHDLEDLTNVEARNLAGFFDQDPEVGDDFDQAKVQFQIESKDGSYQSKPFDPKDLGLQIKQALNSLSGKTSFQKGYHVCFTN